MNTIINSIVKYGITLAGISIISWYIYKSNKGFNEEKLSNE